MSNIAEYKDIIAFHPGYYIAEIIEDMGISQAEFAIRVGTTAKSISTLVNGQSNLSDEMARKLSAMLGTNVDVWLNLQKEYDKKLIEIQESKALDAQKEVMHQIDYNFFTEYAHLPVTRNIVEKILNLCRYLKISDLRILTQPDFLVNYRTGVSTVQPKNIINSRAWLQTAINMSRDILTKPYDANVLKSFLPELRSMTVQEPAEFIQRMQEIFSKCGIAFVLLPHLKNSGINGAVKWVNNERVVLAMNTRGAYADRFWFTLFHEIKHVLQHKTTTTFVSGTLDEFAGINAALETEADLFSSEYLIPALKLKEWSPGKNISETEIIAFAKSINIHPGIVVGRLQHEKIISESRYNDLKEQYTIVP